MTPALPPAAASLAHLALPASQFWNLHRSTGRPMLLVLHAGRAAKRPGDKKQGDAESVGATMGALKSIFGEAKVPAPLATVVTRWHEEEFSRGVYSHVSLGASTRDYDAMAAPLGTILCCGQEGDVPRHPATVAGAFISGCAGEASRLPPPPPGGGLERCVRPPLAAPAQVLGGWGGVGIREMGRAGQVRGRGPLFIFRRRSQ